MADSRTQRIQSVNEEGSLIVLDDFIILGPLNAVDNNDQASSNNRPDELPVKSTSKSRFVQKSPAQKQTWGDTFYSMFFSSKAADNNELRKSFHVVDRVQKEASTVSVSGKITVTSHDYQPTNALEKTHLPLEEMHGSASGSDCGSGMLTLSSSMDKLSCELKPIETTSAPFYFFKHNSPGSAISELEAACCAFYRFIAPNNVATMRAHYDVSNGYQFVGTSSKEIPAFKSLIDDPLKHEDLHIKALKDGLSVTELAIINKKVAKENFDLTKPANIHCHFHRNGKAVSVSISTNDILHYRIIKGLAIGLTTSYLFEEDDLHRGNMDKNGKRIDFDMSLWPVLWHFKQSGIGDWTFRQPGNRFIITAQDIKSFPNIKQADPFYWPTNTQKVVPEPVRTAISTLFTISQNPFNQDEIAVYQQLETHPVFVYFKYKTLLKFILTEPDMYRQIAKLHVRENLRLASQHANVIDMLTDHLASRIAQCKDVLTHSHAFRESFIDIHGATAFTSILTEFTTHNDILHNKIKKLHAELAGKNLHPEKEVFLRRKISAYQNTLVDLEKIKANYKTMTEALVENTRQPSDSILMEPSIPLRNSKN